MHKFIQLQIAVPILLCLLVAEVRGVTIETVHVGNPGNANDPANGNAGPGSSEMHFGAVNYAYRIGKYDVTNAQYAEFLNAVDPTGANALALWNSRMAANHVGGINLIENTYS